MPNKLFQSFISGPSWQSLIHGVQIAGPPAVRQASGHVPNVYPDDWRSTFPIAINISRQSNQSGL